MTKIEELRQKLDELKTFLNHNDSISIWFHQSGTLEVTFHGVETYTDATKLLQDYGIGDRRKSIIDESGQNPWLNLEGTKYGLTIAAYCKALPPFCKKVTETKRIPKTQVVQTEEYVEIQVHRVVCGNKKEGELFNA